MKKMITVAVTASLSTSGFASDIKHIFLATDESRKQLLYVNEFDPSQDWTISLPGNRDLQVVDEDRVLVNVRDGYCEYEIKTGKLLKKVKHGDNIKSAIRAENGHTFIANSKCIWELDQNDKEVSQVKVKMGGFFRLLRFANNGNFLFTGSKTSMKEADRTGKIIREIDLTKIAPKVAKPYFMVQQPDGNYMISTGYDSSLLVVDESNNLIRKIGGRGTVPGVNLNFFGGADVLPNGNIVVANWTGHGAKDSSKGPQAVEFDKSGKIVWSWHNADRAGTFHGIAVIK